MPLQVVEAREADAPRIVELEQLAYRDDVLTPILFPGPFPEGAAEKQADEIVQQLRADPTARWLKVIDTESQDEMIAFAKWNVYEPGKARPAVPPRTFGQGCNAPACKQFWGLMDEKRQHHMGKIPHVCKIDLCLRFRLRLSLLTGRQGLTCCKPIRNTKDEEREAYWSSAASILPISSRYMLTWNRRQWRKACTPSMASKSSTRWCSTWKPGAAAEPILLLICCGLYCSNSTPSQYLIPQRTNCIDVFS